MGRERTGTLVAKPSGFYARLWVAVDGVQERRWVPLNTTDRATARRKMAKLVRLIGEGAIVAEAKREATKAETVTDFARVWVEGRERDGVVMASDEKRNLERHVLPEIGHMQLAEVRPSHITSALATIARKPVKKGKTRVEKMKKGNVSHIRRLMSRVFKAARAAELIIANPVDVAELPDMRGETKKSRAIPTDVELVTYLQHPDRDIELKVMTLSARTEGGMRTAEIHRWDWTMIDRVGFERCVIPRAKNGEPQELEVPEVLRGVLAEWWRAHGSPEHGPVFPCQRGRNRGGFKNTRGNSYARRFRKALVRAGVVRHELHTETAFSRPVDFHSLRRAFASALADANVNAQHAMHLAGHSDAKTHMRYVMKTPAMKLIPIAALPSINQDNGAILALPVPEPSNDDSENSGNSGTPGPIRTVDRRLRRPPLYPAELRARAPERALLSAFARRDRPRSAGGLVALPGGRAAALPGVRAPMPRDVSPHRGRVASLVRLSTSSACQWSTEHA